MTALAFWPGIVPVQRPSAPSIIAAVDGAPPFNAYFSATEFTPCGSLTNAETVIGCDAAGITGLCRTSLKVGPRFATSVEFAAPGVPLNAGCARITVFATLL